MSALHNRTCTSASIPRKLLREGKLHLLPVYALMRTSDLAREGIENSGSYRFADHVYRNEARTFEHGVGDQARIPTVRGAKGSGPARDGMVDRVEYAEREPRERDLTGTGHSNIPTGNERIDRRGEPRPVATALERSFGRYRSRVT